MSYISATTEQEGRIVRVKVYGPQRQFSVTNNDLAAYLTNVVNPTIAKHNVYFLGDYVGRKLIEALKADENALWVEVEVTDTEDHSSAGNAYIIKEEINA